VCETYFVCLKAKLLSLKNNDGLESKIFVMTGMGKIVYVLHLQERAKYYIKVSVETKAKY